MNALENIRSDAEDLLKRFRDWYRSNKGYGGGWGKNILDTSPGGGVNEDEGLMCKIDRVIAGLPGQHKRMIVKVYKNDQRINRNEEGALDSAIRAFDFEFNSE